MFPLILIVVGVLVYVATEAKKPPNPRMSNVITLLPSVIDANSILMGAEDNPGMVRMFRILPTHGDRKAVLMAAIRQPFPGADVNRLATALTEAEKVFK